MANPILNQNFGENAQERVIDEKNVMTVNGTIQLTAFLALLMVVSAGFCWSRYMLGYTDIAAALMGGGLIVGFISVLLVCFARIKYLIPVYAVCEGLALGGVSAIFETSYPGIVTQAVAGTFAALFSMLILYRANVIQYSDKFRSVVFIATLSIFVIYLVDFVGRFFHYSVPFINDSSPIGIGISLVIVVVAALNLIIDFEFIKRGSEMMLPKDYEWFGAFGLLVTLVWLYMEILRLLEKINRK